MEIVESRQDGIATLTLNRPERKNALTVEMRETIRRSMESFATDTSVRAVIITGAGDAFCAGVDASGMGGRDLEASRQRLAALQTTILSIYNIEKPVIAAVRGVAVGVGWSLALACDLVIASETARFCQIFQKMGLAPDGGSAWFLARHAGLLRANDLVMNAPMIGATQALDAGVVTKVVEDGKLEEEVFAYARRLAAGPPKALAFSKRMLHAAATPSLETFLRVELDLQSQLTQTLDYREGIQAFKEKRQPKFTGN